MLQHILFSEADPLRSAFAVSFRTILEQLRFGCPHFVPWVLQQSLAAFVDASLLQPKPSLAPAVKRAQSAMTHMVSRGLVDAQRKSVTPLGCSAVNVKCGHEVFFVGAISCGLFEGYSPEEVFPLLSMFVLSEFEWAEWEDRDDQRDDEGDGPSGLAAALVASLEDTEKQREATLRYRTILVRSGDTLREILAAASSPDGVLTRDVQSLEAGSRLLRLGSAGADFLEASTLFSDAAEAVRAPAMLFFAGPCERRDWHAVLRGTRHLQASVKAWVGGGTFAEAAKLCRKGRKGTKLVQPGMLVRWIKRLAKLAEQLIKVARSLGKGEMAEAWRSCVDGRVRRGLPFVDSLYLHGLSRGTSGAYALVGSATDADEPVRAQAPPVVAGEKVQLHPSQVRFSQETCSETLEGGRYTIREAVVEFQHHWLQQRRLFCERHSYL